MNRYWSALILGLALGCFDPSSENDASESETGGECVVATESCPCTSGGSCDPGLECLSGICVNPGGEGDGDGDGDPTGDGDGDPTGDGDGDPTGDGDGDGGLPNGFECDNGAVCSSGECYAVPFLGGWCGECSADVDCVNGGCTMPNPFDETPVSMCNVGEQGGNCESNGVCQDGLICAEVFDLLDTLVVSSCSECATDSDCNSGDWCAPVFSVSDFSGARYCVQPGSLPINSYCELGAAGDTVCATGYCAPVDVEGLVEIGACGECSTDADCLGTCVPGQLDLATGSLIGSVCN